MIIDKKRNFNSQNDQLMWAKLITIKTEIDRESSTHLVKCYKTNLDEEYYIFDYIVAENNGKNLCNYCDNHYIELRKLLNPKDESLFYEKNINKNEYIFATTGYYINRDIRLNN